ncbi:DotI/IcmL/TraM family protein [Pseudomonas fulva]|uniref:DotI/IcmL/TraM family protein n=1 Tax=Pseudomonas fulva TaxID=47880 RepID=UPI002DBDE33A|nr:DotI/IcmL/TraM family protein [Pseudomonas fulva]MEB8059275.1 DotI/IcmL family type IV secretion protein [Pseudomonas fulva]
MEEQHLKRSDDQSLSEFALAAGYEEERRLGARFANKCLRLLLWCIVGWSITVVICGYLGWRVAHPDNHYFKTEGGRILEIYPLDKPSHSETDVAAFGADTIRESFTLNFVHYRNQLTRVATRYSQKGFEDYYKALNTSNVLEAVKGKRMNLDTEVGPGVISSRGKINGVFTWEFQYPVTLKLQGQQTSSPAQRFIFTQRIQQVDPREKSIGLEVTQVITSSAN